MTNTVLLEKKIQESGKKKGYLATKVGMTLATFRNYCTGKYEFRTSHINILCDELYITDLNERELIFFAKNDALDASSN